MTKNSGKVLDSKPGSLQERAQKTISDHIQRELAPVLRALNRNQTDLQSCTHQIRTFLRVQQEPWRKAATMLWGIVLGVLLYAFLQPGIQHTHDACTLGGKITAAWSALSDSERAVIERIASE